MAVIMEAFSIREYASKMRSVDMLKCWPFDEASMEDAEAILPPITVKKFRWWFDEIVQEDGEEESDFESESLASMRLKSIQKAKAKNKVPKKRSIVELFQVAPQVERVDSEEEEEESDGDSIEENGFAKLKSLGVRNVGFDGKKEGKVKKILVGKINMVEDSKQKLNKKKKRGITTKERCSDPIHLRKTKSKTSATEAKSLVKRTSKLLEKNQKSAFDGHDMLKTFLAKNKTSVHKNQNLNIHAALSLKNDVLGPSRKETPCTELEFLKQRNFIHGVNIADLVDGHPSVGKEIEGESSNLLKIHHIDVHPPTEKQYSVRHHFSDTPKCLTQHASSRGSFSSSCMSSGQCALNSENQLECVVHEKRRQQASFYPCSSSIPFMSHRGYVPNSTVPVLRAPSQASSRGSGTSLLHFSGDLDAQFASVNSMGSFKAYPRSLSCFSSIPDGTANSKLQFPPGNAGVDYSGLTLQRPWLPQMSPKELAHTICNIPDRRSKVTMHGERGINNSALGLPLNSQGEFIRSCSKGKGGLYPLGDSSEATDTNTSSTIYVNSDAESLVKSPSNENLNGVTSLMHQLELCSINDTGNKTDSLMASRLSLIELHRYRQTNARVAATDPSISVETKVERMKMPCVGPRQQDHCGTYLRSEIMQQRYSPDNISMQLTRSTMRLMGQEFRIDGRGFQGPEGRQFYKDKQIKSEQQADTLSHGSPMINSRFLPTSIRHPILGRLKSNNWASQSLPLAMAPEYNQSTIIRQTGYGLSKGNSMPGNYPCFSVSANFMSDYHNSLLPDNLSGYSSLRGSQSFIPEPVFHDSCKNIRSLLQLKNKERMLPARKLPNELPYPCSEFRRHVQPFLCERSFEVIPPVWCEARQRGCFMGDHQAFGGLDSVHPPLPDPYTCHDRDPLAYLTTQPSKFPPLLAFQNGIGSPAMVHRPRGPIHQCSLQDSALLSNYGEKRKYHNQNSRMESMLPNDGNTTKKRLASASNQQTKPMKIPKFGSQEDSSNSTAHVANTSSNLKWDNQTCRERPDSASDKVNTTECDDNGANKIKPRGSTGKASSYKVQGHHRSGAVKLKVVAKHILKPCQGKESKNMPSLSTVTSTTTPPGEVVACENPSEV